MLRVFIPEVICEETHEILAKLAEVRVGNKHGAYSEEELIEEICNVDAVLTTSKNRFTGKVLESTTNLKIIAKCGGKPENIDINSATEKGIVVTWTPNTYENSVAEHTLALILALNKKVCFLTRLVRNGGWRHASATVLHELLGKTIGIVGFGSIGSQVAMKLKGFNVKILAFDYNLFQRRELVEELGIEFVDLGKLLEESDVVTVHLTLNGETRGLIGEKELKKMKESAFIVNTSRGSIIDESALFKALEAKWISGAALDVFEREPPPQHYPLFGMDNVIFSPHVAAWTYESLRKQALMATEDVINVLKGKRPKHVLNPSVFDK
ncbi:MAG: phosphoglycerate dehydrogenase [Candidatus Hodarchaeota archaeon]